MLAVLLLLLVAGPIRCFALSLSPSPTVDLLAAVREYSDKEDPHGHLRHAIAQGNVVRLNEGKCDETETPLAVYVDYEGKEPSLLNPALFGPLVNGTRLLDLERRWCFEARRRGSSAENASLGCYSDRRGNTVLIPLGGKVRGTVFVRSCGLNPILSFFMKNSPLFRPDNEVAILGCPWREFPVGSSVNSKCLMKTMTFICDENLQWEIKHCDVERYKERHRFGRPFGLPKLPVDVPVVTVERRDNVRIWKLVAGVLSGCVFLALSIYRCRRYCKKRNRSAQEAAGYAIPMPAS